MIPEKLKSNLGLEFVFSGLQYDYNEAKAVLYGVPWDSTTSFKPGARFGPDAIREASRQIWTFVLPAQREYFDNAKNHDVGDVYVSPGDIQATLGRIEKVSAAIAEDGKVPMAMGGEHTLTLGAIRPLADKSPVVVYFDAHPDMMPEWLGDAVCHATTLRRVMDFVPPRDVIHVGTRAPSKEEFDFIRDNKITTLWARDVKTNLEKAKQVVAEKTKGREVYVSVDIDVFDMPLVPATGTPEPDGLDLHQVTSILDAIKGTVVGLDVVEVCRDEFMLTQGMAARVLYHALGTMKF